MNSYTPSEFSIIEISDLDESLGEYLLSQIDGPEVIVYPILYLDYIDDATRSAGIVMSSHLFSGPVLINMASPVRFFISQITACYGMPPEETITELKMLRNSRANIRKAA